MRRISRRAFLILSAEFSALASLAVSALSVGPNIDAAAGSEMTLYKGLMVRDGDPNRTAYPPNIEVSIAQIWNGTALIANNPIDKAVATNKPFRVRIKSMLSCPQSWKDASGTFTLVHKRANKPTQTYTGVPRTWTTPFMDRYDAFLVGYAAKYDGVFTYLSGCCWVYAEGCIRDLNAVETRQNLVAAGYTFEKDMASQHHQIDSAASAFDVSVLGMAFNAYDHLYSVDSYKVEEPRTKELMQYFRSAVPAPRSYLTNNALRESYIGKGGVYDDIPAVGKPFGFQTAVKDVAGDLWKAIDWGIKLGASVIELPSGYGTVLSNAQLAAFDLRLKGN